MDLKQKLPERQRLVLVLVGFDQRSERGELGAFDVDLQDVDCLAACSRITNKPNGYGCEVIGQTVRLKEGLKGCSSGLAVWLSFSMHILGDW